MNKYANKISGKINFSLRKFTLVHQVYFYHNYFKSQLQMMKKLLFLSFEKVEPFFKAKNIAFISFGSANSYMINVNRKCFLGNFMYTTYSTCMTNHHFTPHTHIHTYSSSIYMYAHIHLQRHSHIENKNLTAHKWKLNFKW